MYPYNIDENVFISSRDFINDEFNNENDLNDNSLENYPSIDDYILELIKEAISNEYSTSKYYEALSKMSKNHDDEKILRKIHLDDLKHLKIFEEIYYQLTGEKPEIETEEVDIEGDLKDNFAKSIFNKLEDVEFYRRILFSFLNVPIRDWLYEIITDEQAHAQKLQFLYSNCFFNKY